jgi:hypothetical protein
MDRSGLLFGPILEEMRKDDRVRGGKERMIREGRRNEGRRVSRRMRKGSDG